MAIITKKHFHSDFTDLKIYPVYLTQAGNWYIDDLAVIMQDITLLSTFRSPKILIPISVLYLLFTRPTASKGCAGRVDG